MRSLAVFFVVASIGTIGCGTRAAGPASIDAANHSDAGSDAPAAIDAASEAAPAVAEAGSEPVDAVMDAGSERVEPDAQGADGGGSFACGTLTCAADEYCQPAVWATCFSFDGGPCPTGRSACELAGGQMGCRAPCYSQRCTKTITFGCTVSNIPAPRWLSCGCE
jgi:hypothetical protein